MTRLIVIGGVAAGMSAASKAARQAKGMLVDVYTDERHIAYSACSLPYYTCLLYTSWGVEPEELRARPAKEPPRRETFGEERLRGGAARLSALCGRGPVSALPARRDSFSGSADYLRDP